MAAPKTWLAIPAVAVACAGAAAALRQTPEVIVATAALGAALAAVVRGFAGSSVAAAVAGAAAALLGIAAVLDGHAFELARASLAAAAAMFAIAELVRPMPPDESPLPSIGAALLAGVLDPSYVALVPITGWRFIRGPWTRPRGSIALPIVGVLACALAIGSAVAPSGMFADLWATWSAREGTTMSPLGVLAAAGDILGPVTSVAALGGLGVSVMRGRYAAASVTAVVAGSLAVDLATGTLGAALPSVAALGAGMAIARLTGMVRWPTGQTFVAAATGFMMVVAPALAHWPL
ncbi:MAG TPA: hypothetical protein VLB44_27280 [Kofleriaceae bacterium]|nr:hypothetical protein [Kofleriaceae bacterium]